MEDFSAPQHQWPSVELVSALPVANDFSAGKSIIARAVWNSIGAFSSVANWVEGGFLPLAGNNGDLQPFFAEQIFPAIGFSPSQETVPASQAFGRLLVRDLTTALAASGEPYGPEYRGAYIALDSRGGLVCMADLPNRARRSFARAAIPKCA